MCVSVFVSDFVARLCMKSTYEKPAVILTTDGFENIETRGVFHIFSLLYSPVTSLTSFHTQLTYYRSP